MEEGVMGSVEALALSGWGTFLVLCLKKTCGHQIELLTIILYCATGVCSIEGGRWSLDYG